MLSPAPLSGGSYLLLLDNPSQVRAIGQGKGQLSIWPENGCGGQGFVNGDCTLVPGCPDLNNQAETILIIWPVAQAYFYLLLTF